MQFSQAFIIAAAASAELWSLTAATPIQQNGTTLHDALRDPNVHSQFDWKPGQSGKGHFTTINVGGGSKVRRDAAEGVYTNGLGINFDGWHSLANNILGFGGNVKCQEGGVEYAYTSFLQGMATSACADIVGSTTPGKAADNVWLIWKNIEAAGLNPDKTPEHVNFGLQSDGPDPPKLTADLCNQALTVFFGSGQKECAGSDGSTSEGGIVRLFNGDSWLSFLLDPQDDGKSLGE